MKTSSKRNINFSADQSIEAFLSSEERSAVLPLLSLREGEYFNLNSTIGRNISSSNTSTSTSRIGTSRTSAPTDTASTNTTLLKNRGCIKDTTTINCSNGGQNKNAVVLLEESGQCSGTCPPSAKNLNNGTMLSRRRGMEPQGIDP